MSSEPPSSRPPSPYCGRFAPSPTGPLHAGSLVAALASWLDARAQGGQWLVRVEDLDTPRCIPGSAALILKQLADCGLLPDAAPLYQSQRGALYQAALDALLASKSAYPCACSRKDIEAALAAQTGERPRHSELVYPGTCRHGLQGRSARGWRFYTGSDQDRPLSLDGHDDSAIYSIANGVLTWTDRRLGLQHQNVEVAVGDFVLKRADGLWAYQLAVVVDDAAQGISHIVRGQDLADNTPRQILLQHALGLPTPHYLHTPLVLGRNGEKLSKQNGAAPLDTRSPAAVRAALASAAATLGLPAPCGHAADTLATWVTAWRQLYNLAS